MKNINNLLLATFLRKKVPYDSYIKQVRCKNSKEYPFIERGIAGFPYFKKFLQNAFYLFGIIHDFHTQRFRPDYIRYQIRAGSQIANADNEFAGGETADEFIDFQGLCP